MPLFILVLAWLLLFLEFYLPSGVMAAAAAVVYLIAVAMAFSTYGLGWALLFILVGMIGGGCLAWLATAIIKKSSSTNTFYLSKDQEGFLGAEADDSLIGKTGVALSDLRPSGFALIDNKRVQVVSEGRYVEKGTAVIVEACRGGYLVVNVKKG